MKEKYEELKKGFNKVSLKRAKWKRRYYKERRLRREYESLLIRIEASLINDEPLDDICRLLIEYHDFKENSDRLSKIEGEIYYGKRKNSRQK